jgi:polyribonucleotide nucleotidyltransferase
MNINNLLSRLFSEYQKAKARKIELENQNQDLGNQIKTAISSSESTINSLQEKLEIALANDKADAETIAQSQAENARQREELAALYGNLDNTIAAFEKLKSQIGGEIDETLVAEVEAAISSVS